MQNPNYQQNKMNTITGIFPSVWNRHIWKNKSVKWLVSAHVRLLFLRNTSNYERKVVDWSFVRSLPCLLGHLILVSSGQFIQVGLQNRLHLLMVSGAERRGWRLAEGSCCRRRGSPSQGWSGTPIPFYLIVQTLVVVGLERHGRCPVAVISTMWTKWLLCY